MKSAKRKNLLKVAKRDALSAAIECQHRVVADSMSAQRRTRRRLVEAYACACYLSHDHTQWKRFLKHPFWSNRKKKPKTKHMVGHTLRTVLVFVYNAIEKASYDRAYKYSVALSDEFIAGTKPEEIEQKIDDAGGIEKMIVAGLERQKQASTNAKGAKHAEVLCDDEFFNLDTPEERLAKARVTDEKKVKKSSIQVEVREELLKQLFGLLPGKSMKVRYRAPLTSGQIARLLPVKKKASKLIENEDDQSDDSETSERQCEWKTYKPGKKK